MTGKPTGIRVDVVDAGALSEPERELDDVRRVDAPREADDDARVERLALAEPVERELALGVLAELEPGGLRVGDRLEPHEWLREELGRDLDHAPAGHELPGTEVRPGERGALAEEPVNHSAIAASGSGATAM